MYTDDIENPTTEVSKYAIPFLFFICLYPCTSVVSLFLIFPKKAGCAAPLSVLG